MGQEIVLTQEQKAIVDCDVPFLAIKAFAGTGKTTTLIEYARRRPRQSFLYLAFNRSVADHAKKTFPSNVHVVTAHGLAYANVGKYYEHRLDKKLRVYHIREILELKNNKVGNTVSKIVMDLITNFCQSSYLTLRDTFDFSSVYPIHQETLINYAEKVWGHLIDFKSTTPIFPDIYLKIFQLSNTPINKDCILFDEAQDANPAIVDIIYRQMDLGVKAVFVGDEHQAIYAFRGANNTLRKVRPDQELFLTESFRFGEEIAHHVNNILKLGKKEEKRIHGFKEWDKVGDIDPSKQFTILTRTNSNLFLKASEIAESGRKMYFVGGYKSYQFYKIKDVECLYNNKHHLIKDEHIKSFKGFSEMMDISEEVDDKELIYYGKMVDRYKGRVSDVIQNIKNHTVNDINKADIVLSTAHKSKGLEFSQVMLTNDYADFINKQGELLPLKMKEEEINILYVAASRATMILKPNAILKKITRYCVDNRNIMEKKRFKINYKEIETAEKTLERRIESKL